jgi:hypothetical protein
MSSPSFAPLAAAAAAEAARQVGLDADDAALFRIRSAGLVRLERAGVMVRVERADQGAVALRQVQVARFLHHRGAPIAALATQHPQPLVVQGLPVTLWELLHPQPGELNAWELGALLRDLHDRAGPPFPAELPGLDPFDAVLFMLDGLVGSVPDPDLARLRRITETLADAWPALAAADPLGLRVLHGDAHEDNVVRTPQGLLLVDLEMAGVGPASWDLAVSAVGVRRYGFDAAHHRDLVRAYGHDPADWDGFEAMCRSYEVPLVVWALFCAMEDPTMQHEAKVRLDGLLDRGDATWSLR